MSVHELCRLKTEIQWPENPKLWKSETWQAFFVNLPVPPLYTLEIVSLSIYN